MTALKRPKSALAKPPIGNTEAGKQTPVVKTKRSAMKSNLADAPTEESRESRAKKLTVKPLARTRATQSASKTIQKTDVKSSLSTKDKLPIATKAMKKSRKVDDGIREKTKKPKLVLDSFTMPETEYAVLSEVKKACIAAGVEVKKSQLLRLGLVLLQKTPVTRLKKMLGGLTPLKAGRPKNL